MGSTGEADRKRRHFSSISPTAATAKKQPFVPLSEDKKLDAAVLQFQNQKLIQKLEAQRVECIALESKFSKVREKQKPYDTALAVINKSWTELVDVLESSSSYTKDLFNHEQDSVCQSIREDGASSHQEDLFLSRLLQTGATDSSSSYNDSYQMDEDGPVTTKRVENILCNIVTAIDGLWSLRGGLFLITMKKLADDGACRQHLSFDLDTEVKNLRLSLSDLHLKHKSLAKERQCHRDTDAKNKAELKRLKWELECAIRELEESNCKLTTLKAEKDAGKGTFFPVLNLGTKNVASDRCRDKLKDMQDMEFSLKELQDDASNRLLELQRLHEERIEILKKLTSLQNMLRSVKCFSSSPVDVLVKDQLSKAKVDLGHYQALFKKLQVEKDNLAWREREMNLKNDVIDVLNRCDSVADSRITELGMEIQKQIHGRNMVSSKLEEASGEPGRKEIIAEFKALVSSFPDEMGRMQGQLSKYKEAASAVHTLRADVQSFSNVLEQKAKELEALSARSADQIAEIKKLHSMVHDLKDSDKELKLILEMYHRESSDSSDIREARDSECKAWTYVQSLKFSLDEHNLESQVKKAIEAEAVSQQKLAAAEAEIADLRQKLEASKREKCSLTDVLKSKHEENEAYLSEIETIGQAYDDMQTQNQHLLQQITERDDYNIKLVLEGLRARQMRDDLLMDKQTMLRGIQLANASFDYFDMKAARIEDQLKMCSDQVEKLAEDRGQRTVAFETTQKKLLDVRKSSQLLRDSLQESQSKVIKSRVSLADLQMELEKERFEKKREEEELEVARRKVSRLRLQIEGSAVIEKLQQELREYKEILKCSICLDRRKEVVITKCYHLFCNPCVQKIIETRHRKCPVCAASFGVNDVKPVYI